MQFITLQVFQTEHYKVHLAEIKKILLQHPPNPLALAASFELLKSCDLREEMRHITCPVLAIFGRLDALVPHAVQHYIEETLPQAKTVLMTRASHIPFLSHPQQCATEIVHHVL